MASSAELSEAAKFIQNIAVGEFTIFVADMDAFIADIQFQGFDPKVIVAALMKKESDANTLKEDICKMVAILCERGTKLNKIMGRSSPEGVSRIRALKDKYGLVDSGKKADNITLARVAFCLPQFTCSYMAVCLNPAVPWTSLDEGTYAYPRPMACSAFANLLEATDTEMINCHLYWAVHFNKLINPSANKSMKEVAAECLKFAMIGANSTHIPAAKKKSIREALVLSAPTIKFYSDKFLSLTA
ncbi:nucleopasid protein [Elliovirales sp.]|nr:nucleopasid protein [Bunyavirales sp.]